jgi:ABC-2 type transport system ATP-binding protein
LREHTTIFYSTHILDDVQRVSDTVAILNRGRLIAQGPIGDLLASGGSTVFALTTRGTPNGTRTLVASQPWVSSLTTAGDDGLTHWEVGVTDEASAERDLLRLVQADGHTPIVAFGRKRAGLEEIFIKLVEGEKDGR